MAVISASLFASCAKDADVATPTLATPATTQSGSSNVAITLTSEGSRATATAAATAWEKSLSSLTIFAFDASDDLLVRRELSTTELSSASVSFALPKSTSGTECDFYAVANISTSTIYTKSALLALLESDASAYNGTYGAVTTAAQRTGGFVMSGTTTTTIGAVDTTTSVPISIKRSVAKVAIELATSSTFAASYPSATLTFNSATLSRAASQSLVIAASTPSTGDMEYTHTQSTASTPNYLFYIYENGDTATGERVLLEVDATFDADGSADTTNDQSQIIYSVELSGDGAGAISRNGYYSIAATINGLVGQDCDVSITIEEWETPITQKIELGM